MHFSDLGLEPELLRAVLDKGYDTPTPIQQQAIPAVLAGRDVLAGAQTGTGKTAGFVLPLLQKLGQRRRSRTARTGADARPASWPPRSRRASKDYGVHKNLRTRVIFGGVGEQPQIEGLRNGCDLLVATPGRLLDLANRGSPTCRRSSTSCSTKPTACSTWASSTTFDACCGCCQTKRQNLLFSATYNDEIRALAAKFLTTPCTSTWPRATARPSASSRSPTGSRRTTSVTCWCTCSTTASAMRARGRRHWFSRAPSTARTGSRSNSRAPASSSAAIHGNKSQSARVKALADFKAGKITALVATEVASRGLDIKELPQVVNYELPNVPEDYVHRIGRTARAGMTGHAVSLVALG
jgi:ATP-dependent RNA helicase RhlE